MLSSALKASAIAAFALITAPVLASDRATLAARYPDIAEGSAKAENPKILCPFHRLLERAGIYDPEKTEQGPLLVSVLKIARVAREFGCDLGACGGVASAVSTGQTTAHTSRLGKVNVESLHTALGIAHDCGLTFAKGGSTVSDAVRAQTLASLKARADVNGRLKYAALADVKQEICDAQGVRNTFAGTTEIGLIYTFLGGNERGYIDYADVERFLRAELPHTVGNPGVPHLTALLGY